MMLFLTTISTPIAQDLYFLEVQKIGNVTSASSSTLRLGTFGYCLTVGGSAALSPAISATASGCTAAKAGYNLDYKLFTDGDVWGISTGDLSDWCQQACNVFASFATDW